MKRLIGAVLLCFGILPLLALAWTKHMYTVGISLDMRAIVVVTTLVIADVACIGIGLHLITRPRKAVN